MKFDSYHPAINLIYFTAAFICIVCFDQPVFVAISYIAAFIYSVKLNGRRALTFNLCLIIAIFLFAGGYSYYNHFGITVMSENIIGNQMTLESLVFGFVIGVLAASVIMMLSCLFTVFSADKVVYLFGKISPKLSLFLSILLRSVPRIKFQARKINISRHGVGRGCRQGNIFKRALNSCRMVSILITETMENFFESSQSMKSRGYSLKGRTAFSIYRFDNRDRGFVVAIFLCLILLLVAVMFNQTDISYDPQIIFNRITPISYIFYAAYAVLLLLPMILQTLAEIKYPATSA